MGYFAALFWISSSSTRLKLEKSDIFVLKITKLYQKEKSHLCHTFNLYKCTKSKVTLIHLYLDGIFGPIVIQK